MRNVERNFWNIFSVSRAGDSWSAMMIDGYSERTSACQMFSKIPLWKEAVSPPASDVVGCSGCGMEWVSAK